MVDIGRSKMSTMLLYLHWHVNHENIYKKKVNAVNAMLLNCCNISNICVERLEQDDLPLNDKDYIFLANDQIIDIILKM